MEAISLTFISMQISTFTNWLNDRLKGGRHSPKVQSLSEDLRDGTILIRLLENLTKKKIKGYTKNPKMAAHKLVNLDLAFEFMKKEEVKLIGIGMYLSGKERFSTKKCVTKAATPHPASPHSLSSKHHTY